MDFGKVLTRAGEIIWKHKVLWIFGILAGCGAQGSSFNYNFGSRSGGGSSSGPQFDPNVPPFDVPRDFFNDPTGQRAMLIVIGLLLLVFIIAILAFVLGVYGRLGMIEGTRRAETDGEMTFNAIHTAIMPNLGKALGLNFIFAAAVLAIGLVFAAIAIFGAAVTFGLALICIIPLVCLLIPVMWFVAIIIEQANIALVLEEKGIGDALQRGWEITRSNLGEYIGMGLLLVVGGAVVGFVIGLPVFLAMAPMMVGVFGFASGSDVAGWSGIGIALLCMVLYIPVLLLANGIIQGYIKSAWTLTFVALRDKTANMPPEPPLSELPAA